VSNLAIINKGVLKAKQQRYIMTMDITNAFVHTEINQTGEMLIMKISGELVDIIVEIIQEMHGNKMRSESWIG
jgi:hypothetical protein